MKTFVKVIAVVLLIAVFAPAQAQKSVKIGHVDFAKVMEGMPGQDTLKKVIEKHSSSLNDQFKAMTNELQLKEADYQANTASMSAIIKQTKEKEIQDLYQRIQQFQASAQEELTTKQNELVKPFLDKARKAVNDVAKENGFSYILNTVEEVILYSDGGEDITPLVKKKLGIQ